MLHTSFPVTSQHPADLSSSPRPLSRERIVLWRLHGALDTLECSAIATSYGYALSLELAGEPILLELQRSVEDLTAKASRLESWLLTEGWRVHAAQS